MDTLSSQAWSPGPKEESQRMKLKEWAEEDPKECISCTKLLKSALDKRFLKNFQQGRDMIRFACMLAMAL